MSIVVSARRRVLFGVKVAAGALLGACLLVSGTARAGDEDEEQDPAVLQAKRDEAKSRYGEGAQAYKDGRFKDAVDLSFTQALK